MLKRELDYQVTITFHDYFRDPMAPDGEVEWAVREAFDNIGLTVLDVGPLMPVTPPKAGNQVTGRFFTLADRVHGDQPGHGAQ